MASALVLYGSQTGNAQDVAERVGREAQCLGFAVRILPFDACDLSHLQQEQSLLCVAATAGQGECPDNMKKFWKAMLKKNLPPYFLSGLKYAVFGLGDSGYPKYNVAAKKLDRRLLALGASPILERGLGDDQSPSGYEAALDPWLVQLWTQLLPDVAPAAGGPQPDVSQLASSLQLGTPKYEVEMLQPGTAASMQPGTDLELAVQAAASFRQVQAAAAGMMGAVDRDSSGDASSSGRQHGPWRPYFAAVSINKRITAPTHFQDTRHIEFELGDSGLQYAPGDLVAIFPRVDPHVVDTALQRLGWDGDAVVRISARQAKPALQHANGHAAEACAPVCIARLRAIVQGVLDVAGSSPRRSFFQMLRHFASSDLEREKLEEFSSAAGRDDLYRYNQRERRSVLEVLQDFKSASPPLERLLECCPLLQPRLFSISSSLAAHPNQAHITAAVVEWQTPWKRQRRGLLTSWLATLDPTTLPLEQLQVPVWVESGALHMPPSHATPLILVGPGTGVAPFRAFLEERAAAAVQGPVAASLLFFGCRSAAADYYYAEQWQQYVAAGVLEAVIPAFSRDQSSKVYVSHRIREHADRVWQLLQQGAVVYVSGSAQKMPAGVSAALEDVAMTAGGLTKVQAAEYVKKLELTGRYFVEAWS